MAIRTVRAQINGTWYALSLTSGGKWTATVTAPGKTSYNEPGKYYNVKIEATNAAGTTGSADGTSLPGLRLQVRERIAPVITIVSPSSGAYVSNSKQPIVFTVADESGGSGVNPSTISVKMDGSSPAASIKTTPISGGYSCTYTPDAALSDGGHTAEINASDNDGNAAEPKKITYTIDTIPPTLNVSSPADGLITSTETVNVSGRTNDATSSPVTVTITLNGQSQGAVPIGPDGSFSKSVTLRTGENVIDIKATDAAGKQTSVRKTVILDTSVPKVIRADLSPNPVDAGKTMIITVEIAE